MFDVCTDNRLELVEKYFELLKDGTNIETSQTEMAVIRNILFRFWQMGWLDRLEQTEKKPNINTEFEGTRISTVCLDDCGAKMEEKDDC